MISLLGALGYRHTAAAHCRAAAAYWHHATRLTWYPEDIFASCEGGGATWRTVAVVFAAAVRIAAVAGIAFANARPSVASASRKSGIPAANSNSLTIAAVLVRACIDCIVQASGARLCKRRCGKVSTAREGSQTKCLELGL